MQRQCALLWILSRLTELRQRLLKLAQASAAAGCLRWSCAVQQWGQLCLVLQSPLWGQMQLPAVGKAALPLGDEEPAHRGLVPARSKGQGLAAPHRA